MGNVDFVSKTTFDFTDRYNGQEEYFTKRERIRQRWDKANLVPDIRNAEVVRWEERGGDNASMFYDMGGNTILEPHISEFGVGEYKLAHRHPYEAIILILNGTRLQHCRQGRSAEGLRQAGLAAELHRLAAVFLVPPALQHRHDAGALLRRHGRRLSQAAGHPARGRTDRSEPRRSGDSQAVRRGAGEEEERLMAVIRDQVSGFGRSCGSGRSGRGLRRCN